MSGNLPDPMTKALGDWVQQFATGEIDEAAFVNLSDMQRQWLSGAIAGQYSVRHPHECYAWLKALFAVSRGVL